MKVVVTGGAGMIGRRIVAALLDGAPLTDRQSRRGPVDRIVALDVVPPEPPLPEDPRLTVVTGPVDDRALLAQVVDAEVDSVFHLAAVVSAAAEEDFDLGMRANLAGTRALLEACRSAGGAPRLVFASSVAAFGGDLPETVTDATTPMPATTYGVTKVIGEYLVNDYSRKGFVDGRSIRLPTVVIRPGRPNRAASTWASSILREPLAGREAVCPVGPDSRMWVLSPRRAVAAFLHAHELEAAAWDGWRVLNLPGVTISVENSMAALRRIGGDGMVARIRFQPDPFVQRIVDGWPARFETPRALAMGFVADADLDAIVRAFVEDDLSAQYAFYVP